MKIRFGQAQSRSGCPIGITFSIASRPPQITFGGLNSDSSRIRVGIVGASGYSGEVLVDLLDRHPFAELVSVSSRSLAGQPVSSVMPCLRGRAASLTFVDSEPEALAASDTKVFFLALPHGVATDFARPLHAAGKIVIDLSADFRLGDAGVYADYYGKPHPAADLLTTAPYVLADLEPEGTWKQARLIACPGCYPTSILIPLLPLVRARLVLPDSIQVVSMSSVSGAGKKVDAAYLFCERNESVRPYGIPRHRHLSEIEEQLSLAAGHPVRIQFSPHLVPINRGIVSTITVEPAEGASIADLRTAWEEVYQHRPFVSLLEPGVFPDTAAVARTNRIDLNAFADSRTGRFVLTSAEDNLVKGASGQAVQIFNLMHGLPETAGLV